MRKFDTQVQYLKYKVLREVARQHWNGRLLHELWNIPKTIISGNVPTTRCCVYKERAIVSERVKLAMGGDRENPNVIEVIKLACDECPVSGYEVTASCRGCLAHRCEDVCPKGAISFDSNRKAYIDKTKCIECGLCAKACQFNAISNNKRPCQSACKVKAITMDDEKAAEIDESKCIACGACVYQCPFGAIMDKSFIIDAIDILKASKGNTKYNTYAVVAPSISSQFSYAKLGQVVTAIKKLGFHEVVEAALGADMVAYKESEELIEKGFLTSSCCPAFVMHIEKQYPNLIDNISHNLSPMAEISRYIKSVDENAKVIFIGPCTAKKMEFQKESVSPYVDCVLTFEELQALFDSRAFDITAFEEDVLDNASFYGRIFARSGGLADAVAQAIKEHGSDFELNAIACDGIEECNKALIRANRKLLPNNFIEGMACVGGCIGGAGCLAHGAKDRTQVDKYGKEAMEKTIKDAIVAVSLK